MDVSRERNHLHWFRKDLRLHDNPALLKAVENCDKFYAVYILDKAVVSQSKCGVNVNVWRFLIESLQCVNKQLNALGSRLFVVKEDCLSIFPTLFKQWAISRLTFTRDSEPYDKQRDDIVMSLAKSAGVEVLVETSHTLFDVNRYVVCNKGDIAVTFEEFSKVFSSMCLPPSPSEPVGERHFAECVTPVTNNSNINFAIPTLEDVGFIDNIDVHGPLHGGEQEGLRLYDKYTRELSGSAEASTNYPFPKSSKLGCYFRFGCVSIRMVYHGLLKLNIESPGVKKFVRGLKMRDFFYALGSHVPDWDNADGNPLCLKTLPWEENDVYITKFREGKTGFPWIDAIITQAKQEGWIHNDAREALLYFLTRGYLWLSWKEGVKFLEDYCIDSVLSINVANCLSVSGTSFLNQHHHSYCPVTEGKVLDSSGEFVRKYLPALRDMPETYIYEPWKAPFSVQKRAGCIIGQDYPDRMVDHMKAKEACVERLKQYEKEHIYSTPSSASNVIHWFKKDLRLHDNPALIEAVCGGGNLYCIYVFDPVTINNPTFSSNHSRFLLQCLRDLDINLREYGSRLYVIRGSPLHVFRQLFSNWAITKLTLEEDTEPFGKKLEDAVISMAKKQNIEVVTKISHTLYSIPEVIKANNGLVPFTFKSFISTIKGIGRPAHPIPALDYISLYGCVSPHVPGTDLPSLEEFGLDEKTYNERLELWMGGETEALRRFKLLQQKMKCEIADTDTSIFQDVTFPKVSALSPYMRFGCISTRFIHHTLVKLRKKLTNPKFLLNILWKLLFRDFLFTLGHKNIFFDKVNSNPVCLNIPWQSNDSFVTKWRQAKTGFPWIDAVLTQLRLEGYTNNLGRQAMACFLTRGCLWVSWEEGFKLSQELQLDFEWSLCAANWQMISCSSFFVRSDKYYCPVNTGKAHDPQGLFIRKYIPVLRNYPAKYIYDPWNAPLEVQQTAGCIIGKDYPMRIIDHEEAKLVCANRLKEMVGELRDDFSSSVSLVEEEPKMKRMKATTMDGTMPIAVS